MWGRAGRSGSKMSKFILTLSHGAGLKSCHILTPPPLQDRENPCRAKREGAGKNCHPYSYPPCLIDFPIVV